MVFAIQLSEIQQKMIQRLKVGQSYVLNTIEFEDLRKPRKKEEMIFIRAYKSFALFETRTGRKESFLYQDLYFQSVERNSKK